MKNVGYHAYRLKSNPVERIFAEEWDKQNAPVLCGRSTLAYLVDDGKRREDVTKAEVKLAATMIQWLGSPVGQDFLRVVNERIAKELGKKGGRNG